VHTLPLAVKTVIGLYDVDDEDDEDEDEDEDKGEDGAEEGMSNATRRALNSNDTRVCTNLLRWMQSNQ
jgi:hypothetical protein